jgi:hypothetical protein
MAQRTVWNLSNEEFVDLVKTSQTKKEIMEKIGNNNHRALNKRLKELDDDLLKPFKDRELAKYKKVPIQEVSIIVKEAKTMTELWVKLGYSHRHGSGDKSLIEYLSLNNIDISHLDLPSQRIKLPLVFDAKLSKLKDIQINFIEQQQILQQICNKNNSINFDFCVEKLTKINDLLENSKQIFIELQNHVKSDTNTESYINNLTAIRNDKIPLKNILIVNSTYEPSNLKKRLQSDGIIGNIIENRCAICGMDPVWHGVSFELDLDHINGIHTDNRIENLRLLCQICHKLTPTYGGKNIAYQKLIKGTTTLKKFHCEDCDIEIDTKKKYCINCLGNHIGKSERHVERPSYNDLIEEVVSTNYREAGKKYGVSDKTIRNWIIAYGYACPDAKEVSRLRNLRKLKANLGNKKIQLKVHVSDNIGICKDI